MSKPPLFVFLLEPSHYNRYDSEGVLKHFVGDFDAPLSPIDLLEDASVDRSALTAKARGDLEGRSFRRQQCEHLLRDGLEELNALLVRLDIEIIVVALLLDAVEALLVSVFPVRNESTVLGCPGRMRGPFVVEDGLAELVTAGARLESLLFYALAGVHCERGWVSTYSLWEESVARAKPAAVAQRNLADGRRRKILNDILVPGVPDDGHEVGQELRVAAHELVRLEDEDILADQIKVEQVEELQELGRRGAIANVLLGAFKEGKVVLCRDSDGDRPERLRNHRRKRGLDELTIGRAGGHLVRDFGALVGRCWQRPSKGGCDSLIGSRGGHDWRILVRTGALLGLFARAGRRRKVSDGRHLGPVARRVGRLGRRGGDGHRNAVFRSRATRASRGGRFGQELLEVLEEIGCGVEERRDLGIYVLDRFLLALVRLENLQELLVDLWPVLKAVLGSRVSNCCRC